MIPIKSLKIFQSFVSEPRLQLSKRWPSKAAPRTGCVSNLGHSQVKSVSGKDATLPQLFIKTLPLNAKGHVSAVVFCSLSTFFVFLAKINDLVTATYRVMKSKLPSTLQSMSLYLANRDTEFILFKPVRVGRSAASL